MPEIFDHQHLTSHLREILRLSAWLVLLVAIFLPLERLFALHPRKFVRRSLAQDVGYYFISGLVPGLLMAVPLSVAAYGAHHMVPSGMQAAVAAWPLWLRALAGLIVSEIGFYWGHRCVHQIPFLWRFHSIHHSADQIYFLISARAHPVDSVFIRLCGFVPVYILGIATPLTPDGGTVAAILVLVLTVWGFFVHSNLRWRLGPLEWAVATPYFHHWHHTMGQERDHNYAPTLPLVDWVFGTLHLPRDQWPAAYGIDNKMPATLAGQLMSPFRPPQDAEKPSAPLAADR